MSEADRKRIATVVESAWREGWAACRDAEYSGSEAEDFAYGDSRANYIALRLEQGEPCETSGDADRKQKGEVVVTKNGYGEIIAVTRQDEEGQILSVIAEADSKRRGEPVALTLGHRAVAAELLACFRAWEPMVYVLGNVMARDGADLMQAILNAAPQPADPVDKSKKVQSHAPESVKVPTDDEIISLAREYGGCFARSSRMLQFDFEQPGILNFARALLARYGQPDQPSVEPVKVPIDAAVAAIQFALETDEGIPFLQCWNEGDFDAIRLEWPEAPESVFIGADPMHPETRLLFGNPAKEP